MGKDFNPQRVNRRNLHPFLRIEELVFHLSPTNLGEGRSPWHHSQEEDFVLPNSLCKEVEESSPSGHGPYQRGWIEHNARLLEEFANSGLPGGLSPLNASSRGEPPGSFRLIHIVGALQKDVSLPIEEKDSGTIAAPNSVWPHHPLIAELAHAGKPP